MDRATIYAGQLPDVKHVLLPEQFAMVGLGKLAEAIIGAGAGAVDGFTCTPTSPTPNMSVVIGPGTVYQSAQLEASTWSTVTVDTHPVVKQGIALDPTVQTLTAPTTPGYAVNVLLQVKYQDVDDTVIHLPFYNSSNPSSPLDGIGGNGQPLSTVRRGAVAFGAKYGTAATSGTQLTPAPDAGWIGVFVITLTYGQTQIGSGSIATYPYAPFALAKLLDIPKAVQDNRWTYCVDNGTTGSAIIANLFPAPTNVGDGFRLSIKLAHDLQAGATLNVGGFSGPLARASGASIVTGDYRAGDIIDVLSNLGIFYITNSAATLADIETTITKTVGGTSPDFADLNIAFAWAARRRVRQGGQLNLQMAAGKFTYNVDINFSHQDGQRITIVGAALVGSLPAPSSFSYTGFSSGQQATDTTTNLATLRTVFTTEIAFTGVHRMFVYGALATLQDVLFTSDGTAGADNLVLQFGVQSLNRVWSVGANGRGIATAQSYTTISGVCGALGCGIGIDAGSAVVVQPGATLGGMSCANFGMGGTISCASFSTSTLYARGCGVNGIQGGFIVASSVSVSRDCGQASYTIVNNGAMNANGASGSGSTYLFQAGQGGYIDASNGGGYATSGSATSGYYARAFLGGTINRYGTTCTGSTSPAIGSVASDGAVVY